MEVTAIERKMFGQKMRLKSMSCTEIVHPRWKAARPFTDSLEQINIITNAIRTDFVQQMQLFDVFIPILCFPLDAFFPHLSHCFFYLHLSHSLQAILFLCDSQSNQQIMCPTSSHRKTQIPHIFCRKKHNISLEPNRKKKQPQ